MRILLVQLIYLRKTKGGKQAGKCAQLAVKKEKPQRRGEATNMLNK